MKKSLLLLAAAAMVVGCSKNEILNETVPSEVLIGFGDSYVGKKVKSGEVTNITTLQTNNGTMKVWGWKTTKVNNVDTPSKVFDDQLVEYDANYAPTNTNWKYSPLKYWDMEASNYSFYAVSPNTTKFDINDNTRIISGTDIEKVQILADNNGASQITSSNTTAIDYLVAEIVSKVPKGNDATDNDVTFTFSHILSKLVVKVKTSNTFNNSGDTYPQIKLTGLSIKLQGMCPNYTQKTAGAVTASATSGDTWSGTAMGEISYTCFASNGSSVTDKLLTNEASEIASYLIAPTATGETPATFTYKATVDYDIYYSATASDKEHFTATDKNISTLTSFTQNTNNTLTITIDPKAIYFDVTTVNNRTNGSDGTLTVE